MSEQIEKTESTETDVSVNIRTFKKTPEVENFYRFVYDNNLQKEAKRVLETVYKEIAKKKAPKKRKRTRKLQ